jgi:hypothetical protein
MGARGGIRISRDAQGGRFPDHRFYKVASESAHTAGILANSRNLPNRFPNSITSEVDP